LAKKYKLKKRRQEEEQEQDNSLQSRFIGDYARSPRRERTPEEKKEYKKLALFLVGWFILVASVYFACIQIEEAYWIRNRIVDGIPVTVLVYMILAAVFFLIWLVFNGGFKKIDFEKYEKPDEMGYDEYQRIIDKLKERQKKAKYFLILFMPFFMVMLIDAFIMRLSG